MKLTKELQAYFDTAPEGKTTEEFYYAESERFQRVINTNSQLLTEKLNRVIQWLTSDR